MLNSGQLSVLNLKQIIVSSPLTPWQDKIFPSHWLENENDSSFVCLVVLCGYLLLSTSRRTPRQVWLLTRGWLVGRTGRGGGSQPAQDTALGQVAFCWFGILHFLFQMDPAKGAIPLEESAAPALRVVTTAMIARGPALTAQLTVRWKANIGDTAFVDMRRSRGTVERMRAEVFVILRATKVTFECRCLPPLRGHNGRVPRPTSGGRRAWRS